MKIAGAEFIKAGDEQGGSFQGNAALHWLQDNGYRTLVMLCPSLPQEDYDAFSRRISEAVRVDRCEHVWAEILNARGESMRKDEALRLIRDFEAYPKAQATLAESATLESTSLNVNISPPHSSSLAAVSSNEVNRVVPFSCVAEP